MAKRLRQLHLTSTRRSTAIHRNGNGSQAFRKGGEAKRVILLLVIIIITIQRERQCRERYTRSGRGVRYDKRSTINNDSGNDKEVWAGDNGGWQGNRKKYVFFTNRTVMKTRGFVWVVLVQYLRNKPSQGLISKWKMVLHGLSSLWWLWVAPQGT